MIPSAVLSLFNDGIKRDRWVWSGDAYQSMMVNPYLYFDKEIDKRTSRALPFMRREMKSSAR